MSTKITIRSSRRFSETLIGHCGRMGVNFSQDGYFYGETNFWVHPDHVKTFEQCRAQVSAAQV